MTYSKKLNIVTSKHFEKDMKLAKKRGLKFNLLEDVVETLVLQKPLSKNKNDYALTGKYAKFRECHIQPDWSLIYRTNEENLYLFLFRTETHSDLF